MEIKRKLDDLGRLVVPKHIRKELGLKSGDEVNIELVDRNIIVTTTKRLKNREEIENEIQRLVNTPNKDYKSELIEEGIIKGLKWVLNDETDNLINDKENL